MEDLIDIPVVIMAAGYNPEDENKASAGGAFSYMVKSAYPSVYCSGVMKAIEHSTD